MTKRELLEILNVRGWFLAKDEVGDVFAILSLKDRVISVIPNVKNLKTGQAVHMRESVSTKAFSKALSHIAGQDETYWPLKTRFGSPFHSENFSAKDISAMLDNIKTWGNEINLEAELAIKRNLPTQSAGTLPLYHLAALALNKGQSTLALYQDAFENDDRLGFVPYISKEHILRSLEVSNGQLTTPQAE